MLVPVTSSRGELWVEGEPEEGMESYVHKEGDEVINGFLLQPAKGTVKFDSRRRHMVLPWKGDRIVVAAYNIRSEERLKEVDVTLLTCWLQHVQRESKQRRWREQRWGRGSGAGDFQDDEGVRGNS